VAERRRSFSPTLRLPIVESSYPIKNSSATPFALRSPAGPLIHKISLSRVQGSLGEALEEVNPE